MLAAFVVPRRVAVVTEDEFGADPRDFASGTRCLGVAEIAEKLNCFCETFGGNGILSTAFFKFKHVEDLAT